MENLYSFTFIILLSLSSPLQSTSTPKASRAIEEIRSVEGLDQLIRDYTFKSYDNTNSTTKTGETHDVDLPADLSGIWSRAGRFRCGSLSRYGARIGEFIIGGSSSGLVVSPCVERVMLITTDLGVNWSSTIYYANYNKLKLLSAYKLVSPILGLMAYNAGSKKSSPNHPTNSSNPFEIGITCAQGNPITVNFTATHDHHNNNNNNDSGLCATFGRDGKVSLKPPISPQVCAATTTGHYGLVVKVLLPPISAPEGAFEGGSDDGGGGGGGRAAGWKVGVGSGVGGVLGIVLLGLLMVAMFGKAKKKARMVEMERKAYEEEALQVSMVGHVRAPLASSTRTVPTIEHHHSTPYNPSSTRKK